MLLVISDNNVRYCSCLDSGKRQAVPSVRTIKKHKDRPTFFGVANPEIIVKWTNFELTDPGQVCEAV